MKSLYAFIIPVLLAIAAGVLNFLALRGEVKSYVVAKAPIKEGEKIRGADLEVKHVRGAIHGAIQWEDRDVLNLLPAPRQIDQGEFILRQDISPQMKSTIALDAGKVAINISLEGVKFEDKLIRVGQVVGFVIGRADKPTSAAEKKASKDPAPPDYEIVGPYKVVTLGSKISDDGTAKEENAARPSTLSIAVSETLDDKVKRLLEANSQRRIAAVVFYEAGKKPE